MKRIALFVLVMLSFTLSSCQCASPPPIGPVEDETATAVRTPDTSPVPMAVRPT